jgi:hypothetical protein
MIAILAFARLQPTNAGGDQGGTRRLDHLFRDVRGQRSLSNSSPCTSRPARSLTGAGPTKGAPLRSTAPRACTCERAVRASARRRAWARRRRASALKYLLNVQQIAHLLSFPIRYLFTRFSMHN